MWCLILWQLVSCVDKIARLQKNLHDLPVGRNEIRGEKRVGRGPIFEILWAVSQPAGLIFCFWWAGPRVDP